MRCPYQGCFSLLACQQPKSGWQEDLFPLIASLMPAVANLNKDILLKVARRLSIRDLLARSQIRPLIWIRHV